MRNKAFFYFVLFLFSAINLCAQTFSFDNYTVREGLSQSNVVDIIQDHKGNIWLATESGVSKFDGKTFINYTTDDGLADNNVVCMLLDNKGYIWFGHLNGMISRYDGNEFESIEFKVSRKPKKIFSIIQDNAGKIWISTSVAGAIVIDNPEGNLYDSTNVRSIAAKEGLSAYVFGTLQTHDNTMLIITDVGIKYYDAKQNKFDYMKASNLPRYQITAIIEDRNNNLWFGTYQGGLAKYEPKKDKFTYYTTNEGLPNNFVTDLIEDKTGNIWIATWGGGVGRYNGKTIQKFGTENGFPAEKVPCIYEDREGNILFGTFGNGIAIYKGEKFISYTKANGLLNEQVSAVEQDANGNIWLGTNEGMSIFNVQTNEIKIINNSNKAAVRALKRDAYGNIWIGQMNKILRASAGSTNVSRVGRLEESSQGFVNSIEIDKDNNPWFGTTEGVIVYNVANNKVVNYRQTEGLASYDVNCIYRDDRDRMWVACSDGGLSIMNPGGTRFNSFGKDDGFTHRHPTCITQDKKGNMWIGTKGGGVFVYDGKKFTNYKIKDGLISDFITLLTVDNNNNVWIGSNIGLTKFDAATETFFSYGKMDGFTGVETKQNAVLKDKAGKIWFGTVNGVTVYDPAHDKVNELESITNITRIAVNYSDIKLDRKPEFNYNENLFTFYYSGICISNPEEVKYQVMLEGQDKDWRPVTKQNYETYSNLNPGKYLLKVKSTNNRGVWNKEPATYSFVINPPWYNTWWAWSLYVIIVSGSVYGYIRYRERALRKEKEILEHKVDERTAEVVEKNKELDEKNKDITASIRYAKRIQDAILPPDDFVRRYLPNTFVLYKPKDIVSGDFYWLYNYLGNVNRKDAKGLHPDEERGDVVLFAAVDCTGHGVPGAFMSIVGHNLLDQIVGEHNITEPAAILDALNKSVSDTLRQSYTDDQSIRDGMDITLCSFNRKTNILQYAGANNPMYLIRKNICKSDFMEKHPQAIAMGDHLIEIKGNKFPIGNLKVGEDKRFTNHNLQLQEGDTIYLFSDGYADQFGGPNGKKFKYSTLKELLVKINDLDMENQKMVLSKTIEDWKGNLEQVDDLLMIGTRL